MALLLLFCCCSSQETAVPPGTGGSGASQGAGGSGGTFCHRTREVCDGQDNDCDGLVDEDQPAMTCSCGITGPSCAGGVPVGCEQLVLDRDICGNGIDDDCDGLVDCADPDCTVPRPIFGAETWTGQALPLPGGGFIALVFGEVPLPENYRAWILRVNASGDLVEDTSLGFVFSGRLLAQGDGSILALTMGLSGIELHRIGPGGDLQPSMPILPRGQWLSSAAVDPSDGSVALLLAGDTVADAQVRWMTPSGTLKEDSVEASGPRIRSLDLVSDGSALWILRAGDGGVDLVRVARTGLADTFPLGKQSTDWVSGRLARDGTLLVLTHGEVLHLSAQHAVTGRLSVPQTTLWEFPWKDGGVALVWPSPQEHALYMSVVSDLDGTPAPAVSLGPGDVPLWVAPGSSGAHLLAVEGYRGVFWSEPGSCP